MALFDKLNEDQGAGWKGFCGPSSLSYCLSILGIYKDKEQIMRACGLTPKKLKESGADNSNIVRGIKHYGLRHKVVNEPPNAARSVMKRLREHLQRGMPAMISVDWDEDEDVDEGYHTHWIAAIGYDKENAKYVVVDPIEDNVCCSYYTEKYLIGRMLPPEFDLILVKPGGKGKAVMVSDAFFRALEDYPDRGEDFEEIESTLDSIFGLQKNRASSKSYPVSKFINENKELIVDNIVNRCGAGDGEVTRVDLKNWLRSYEIVASCRGYVLPRSQKTRNSSLIALTVYGTTYYVTGTLDPV